MKIKFVICVLLLSLSVPLYGADPFNRQDSTGNTENISVNCSDNDETVIAPNLAIKALKLVGVVLYGEQSTAYFSDEKGQLFSVKKGERVAQEGYLLSSVQKHQLILSNAHCMDSHQQIIRF